MQVLIDILGKTHVYEVDEALTIEDLKKVIEDKEFIPREIQTLSTTSSKILAVGTLCDNGVGEAHTLSLSCAVLGGTRYKKASSQMRWKWRRKRIKRLQRRRRKMRCRAK